MIFSVGDTAVHWLRNTEYLQLRLWLRIAMVLAIAMIVREC